MGFSLSPMHNSTVSPENSNGRVRLGSLKNIWFFFFFFSGWGSSLEGQILCVQGIIKPGELKKRWEWIELRGTLPTRAQDPLFNCRFFKQETCPYYMYLGCREISGMPLLASLQCSRTRASIKPILTRILPQVSMDATAALSAVSDIS